MRGDPLSETLINPSAKQIRDRKIDLWRQWQALNDMPGEIIVRRGYDLLAEGRSVMIIVRSLVPRHMTWNG
jgi:hypothetical protein